MQQPLFLIIGLIIGYLLFKKLMVAKINYADVLNRGGIVVDVRTPQEYDGGHIKGSLNIPLGNIGNRAADLKTKNVPVICVCASGMRSGQAASILKKNGIESYNGGNWGMVNRKING